MRGQQLLQEGTTSSVSLVTLGVTGSRDRQEAVIQVGCGRSRSSAGNDGVTQGAEDGELVTADAVGGRANGWGRGGHTMWTSCPVVLVTNHCSPIRAYTCRSEA